jgi:hypothetical protein
MSICIAAWFRVNTHYNKLVGLQFSSMDCLSLVLTPGRILWTIPLSSRKITSRPSNSTRAAELFSAVVCQPAEHVLYSGLLRNINYQAEAAIGFSFARTGSNSSTWAYGDAATDLSGVRRPPGTSRYAAVSST